jgi:hypothetical protein
MQTITTIGLDIAKSVFQVHGVDAEGNVVLRRQLKRRYVLAFFQKLPSCLVGIEACASSHYWSRELQALGHTVRLMPPAYALAARWPPPAWRARRWGSAAAFYPASRTSLEMVVLDVFKHQPRLRRVRRPVLPSGSCDAWRGVPCR